MQCLTEAPIDTNEEPDTEDDNDEDENETFEPLESDGDKSGKIT